MEIIGLRETITAVVIGMEKFQKLLDEGQAGDNVGLLLRGVDHDEVERGQVIAKPGSITPHNKFLADVYVLKKEEGGRQKAFFTGYRPQFYIRTMDVTGEISLPEGVKQVRPGDKVRLTVELIAPVALEQGSKFAIREGGLTVGAGIITKTIATTGATAQGGTKNFVTDGTDLGEEIQKPEGSVYYEDTTFIGKQSEEENWDKRDDKSTMRGVEYEKEGDKKKYELPKGAVKTNLTYINIRLLAPDLKTDLAKNRAVFPGSRFYVHIDIGKHLYKEKQIIDY